MCYFQDRRDRISDNQKDPLSFSDTLPLQRKTEWVSDDYQDGIEAGGVGIPCRQFCSFTIFDEVLYGS